jgi:general secretion pathway protein H
MMPTSETGASNSGFTLLEMMVVLVILGITLSLVTLSFRSPGTRPLLEQAQQLVLALNAARAESELQGRPIQFVLDPKGWHFYGRTAAGTTELASQVLPSGQFNPVLQSLQPWPVVANQGSEVSSLSLWIEPSYFQWAGLVLQSKDQRVWLKPDGLGGVTAEVAP